LGQPGDSIIQDNISNFYSNQSNNSTSVFSKERIKLTTGRVLLPPIESQSVSRHTKSSSGADPQILAPAALVKQYSTNLPFDQDAQQNTGAYCRIFRKLIRSFKSYILSSARNPYGQKFWRHSGTTTGSGCKAK